MTRRDLLTSSIATMLLNVDQFFTAEEHEVVKHNATQPKPFYYHIESATLRLKGGTEKILAQNLNMVFDLQRGNGLFRADDNVEIGRLVGPHADVTNFFQALNKGADLVVSFDVDNFGTIEHTLHHAISTHCGLQVHSGNSRKPNPEDMIVAENFGIMFPDMSTKVIQKPLTESLQHEGSHK